MFYRMIERARDSWLASRDCTVNQLIDYMQKRGMLRDAQLEAVKTYLFLKIACDAKPLAELFSSGRFNSLDLDALQITRNCYDFLKAHPEAAALFEYACLKNSRGEQVSRGLEQALRAAPETLDCEDIFRKIFYNVSYADYLFSLPMGAGKTFLMAAFIYLDLYFAQQEPQNKAFARNFMIFAPSGLKSSVVPSLKTIENFDPSWVLPEPSASNIKRKISFEVLDQNTTASKSNKTKNPNVQKIANHQPLSSLFGLVAVTNAEKVILDRVQKDGEQQYIAKDWKERLKDEQANELRELIGQLPSLSIFIDEVHHAVTDEIKLRSVVNKWAQNGNVNCVVGFSGTPYLEKTEKLGVTERLSVATAEITNIVYYYPLVNGVGNFLKRPVVKISDTAKRETIIEKGVREFFDSYKDTVYAGGLTAKLGIYCGTIETLEETVYPLVSRIAAEYGITAEQILKFHRGSNVGGKKYPQPQDSQLQYDTLDRAFSKIRIVLLVQIGKEGWDCKSLTGIILSQEGDCPKNMVLQTSCRCLRQVEREASETALIYLNEDNGKKLETQLKQQQHISIKEFMKGGKGGTKLNRYNRTEYLRLPKIEFCQLAIKYDTLIVEEAAPAKNIPLAAKNAKIKDTATRTVDFVSLHRVGTVIDAEEKGTTPATFIGWLGDIAKESYMTLTVPQLLEYEQQLRAVYEEITYIHTEDIATAAQTRYFSSKYDIARVNANIRRAFTDKRTFSTKEELVDKDCELLNISKFESEIRTDTVEEYYPDKETVENIVKEDRGELNVPKEIAEAAKTLEKLKQTSALKELLKDYTSHPRKDRSFHYLPYHTDSSFEQRFLEEILSYKDVERYNLEVYYNGERTLTNFKIECYSRENGKLRYIGFYTPDFLIIQRNTQNEIERAVIVETKGSLYANDPNFIQRKNFMQSDFLRLNNEKFGYRRFEYLYLEDSDSEDERIDKTHATIEKFFGGEDNAR